MAFPFPWPLPSELVAQSKKREVQDGGALGTSMVRI